MSAFHGPFRQQGFGIFERNPGGVFIITGWQRTDSARHAFNVAVSYASAISSDGSLSTSLPASLRAHR